MRDASGIILLHGAPVFDVESATFVDDCELVIESGTIVEWRRPARGGDDAGRLDVAGRWLVPGLIDAHRHLISTSAEVVDDDLVMSGMLEGARAAADTVGAGTTFIRDAGCRHRGIYHLRRAAKEGQLPGPGVYASGPNITGPAAPRSWRNVFGTTPEKIRDLVRSEAAAGADWIKLVLSQATVSSGWQEVTWFMGRAEIAAAVEVAHEQGLKVGCHCEGDDVARAAVDAGVDVLDHAPSLSDETIERMASTGTAYVPTAWAFSTRTMMCCGEVPDERIDDYRESVERRHQDTIRRAAAAGITIAAGTDGDEPTGYTLAAEVDALIEAGLTTGQALLAATVGSAVVCLQAGLRGSLAPGHIADVVALDANPLLEPAALRRPSFVMQGGVLVDRTSVGATA